METGLRMLALTALIAVCTISSVCSLKSLTGPTCVTSCETLSDGNYQSCDGCTVYATCNHGVLYDGRLCAPFTVWDDHHKECVWRSSTCVQARRRFPSLKTILSTTPKPLVSGRSEDFNEVVEETSGDADQLSKEQLLLVA